MKYVPEDEEQSEQPCRTCGGPRTWAWPECRACSNKRCRETKARRAQELKELRKAVQALRERAPGL